MQRLTEGRRAEIDVILRTDGERPGHTVPRLGLRTEDVLCRLKRRGTPAWQMKILTPASWRECGHGVYTLDLDSEDVRDTDQLVVFLEAPAMVKPTFAPELLTFDVVPALPTGVPAIPQTTLCGHVLTLGLAGKQKAQVTARVAQVPLVLGGAGISNDVVAVETNEDGYFELTVVTGALVTVQIQAINYQRQFVVPSPPAPGIPVRLFSL